MSKYLMGIDIGTYSSKGVLVDAHGHIAAESTKEHDLIIPKSGWAEHDAEKTWWGDLCSISKDLIQQSNLDPNQIAAVGCSAIGPDLLAVDQNCNPLHNAILYGIDTRSKEEICELENSIGTENVFSKCANPLSTQAVGPKILWLKKNKPHIYKDAHKFVTGTTYLVAKLTGRYVIDHYSASTFTPLYDFDANQWNHSLCQGIVEVNRLPKIMWSSEIAGTISKEAHSETELAVGTPVICGTIDAAAEAISAGVTEPGNLMLMYGTTMFLINVTAAPKKDARLWAAPFLFPNTYAVMGGMATTGALTVWFKENFAKELIAKEKTTAQSAFKVLAENIKDIPPGSKGLVVLPYFSGERTPINNPDAKGIIFGLDLTHSREHIYKAILESVGYGISQHFDVFNEMDAYPNKTVAVGGGTKNKEWLQIVSDIGGFEQYVPKTTIGAAYGDAYLAAMGIGLYHSYKDISQWVQYDSQIQPNPNHNKIYKSYQEKYYRLYNSTKELL